MRTNDCKREREIRDLGKIVSDKRAERVPLTTNSQANFIAIDSLPFIKRKRRNTTDQFLNYVRALAKERTFTRTFTRPNQ